MRLGGFLFSAIALGAVVVGTQACSVFEGDTGAKEDRICTAGNYVFCRCADRTPGTKLCKDGTSFEACTTGSEGECVGGEIEDPDTGKDVDENGEPVDPGDPKPTNSLDSCPGKSTAVQPNVALEIEGDTNGAGDDGKGRGSCAVGAGGGDHVYRLIPSGTGSLELKVQGSGGMNPLVYVRSTCDKEDSQASCGPPGPNALAQIRLNVVTGKEYYVFVDGASSSAGKYTLSGKLTTGSFCGDGKVDLNEACDDTNHDDNDGCGPGCTTVNGDPPSGASCPGQPVHVWPGKTVTGNGSNQGAGYGNAFNKPGNSCDPAIGTNAHRDHVYEVTPHATGTLVVVVTPKSGANLMVSARSTCADPNSSSPAKCSNNGSDGATETINVPVTKDQKLFVAVDGAGTVTPEGTYTISFKIQ